MPRDVCKGLRCGVSVAAEGVGHNVVLALDLLHRQVEAGEFLMPAGPAARDARGGLEDFRCPMLKGFVVS